MSRTGFTRQSINHLIRYLGLILSSLILVACSSQRLNDLRNSPGTVRVLLITQNNRLFEYEVKGLRGTARGYPQPFAQWHAVVLDENRQPLAMYSIWDPRLVLEHGPNGASWQALDSATSSLFDVVVPFSYDEDDLVSTTVLPRLVQIYDEAKTLLFEVDVTDALNEYCTTGEGVGTQVCLSRQAAFPLPPMPPLPNGLRLPNYQTPVDERPQATIDPVIIFGNPAPIAECIPLYEEQPDNVDIARDSLLLRASHCSVLNQPFSALACPSVEFEPGVGLFAPDANVSGLSWNFGTFTLALDGAGSYTGNGVLLEPNAELNLALGGCIATSVEMKLRPPDTQTDGTVILKNGDITKSLPLPLPTRGRLRIGALPLAQDTSLISGGSNAIVERIRINLPPETEATITATVTLTPTQAPNATETPTFTLTSTDTPSPTPIPPSPTPVTPSPAPLPPTSETGTPAAVLCTVVSSSLNLRAGPGVNNRVLRSLSRGTELIPLARNSDNSWLQVTVQASGEQGWVGAGTQFVRCGGEPPPVTVAPPTAAASTPAVVITPAAPGGPCVVYDFETGGGWVRGDEAWGTFAIAAEQVSVGNGAGKFDYNFPAGTPNNYFVYRRTDAGLPIACQPVVLCMQVYGDGSGNYLNTWVDDAQGTRWQFTFGRVTHTGWQEMAARLDPNQGWPNVPINNTNATAVVQPLRLYAFIVDGAEERAYTGTIYVDNLFAANACTAVPTNPPAVTATPPSVTPPSVVTPPDQPTLNPPPPTTNEPEIGFTVDDPTLEYGDCTTLRWSVRNVRAVYLEDEGVVGQGEEQVCPDETTDYTIRVITPTDERIDRTVTVTVEGSGPGLEGTWVYSGSDDPLITELEIFNDSGLVVKGFGNCSSSSSSSSCVNFGTERLRADGDSFVATFDDVQRVELKIRLDGNSLRTEVVYTVSASSCRSDDELVRTDGSNVICRYADSLIK